MIEVLHSNAVETDSKIRVVEDSTGDGEEHRIELDEEDLMDSSPVDIPMYLSIPRFECLDENPVTFLNVTRVTSSDVMSTTVTTRVLDYDHSQNRSYIQRKNNPKLARVQLPLQRNQTPTLRIPTKRLNKKLLKERDKFMTRLRKEREDREQLEGWAATKIQAAFRGFRCRPKQFKGLKRKKQPTSVSNIRHDLRSIQMHMDGNLDPRISEPHSLPPGVSSPFTPEWRRNIDNRAKGKREARHRKDREHVAATKIQSIVRGFLARIGYRFLFSRYVDEVYLRSLVKIQSSARGYIARREIKVRIFSTQRSAALKIQSLVRGVLARETFGLLLLEKKKKHQRKSSLTNIFHSRSTKISSTMAKTTRTAGRDVSANDASSETLAVTKGIPTHKYREQGDVLVSRDLDSAATRVQAIVRGRQSRARTMPHRRTQNGVVVVVVGEENTKKKKKKMKNKNKELDTGFHSSQTHLQSAAATSIQRHFRGHLGREKSKKTKRSDTSGVVVLKQKS